MADENVPGARGLTLREHRNVSVVGGPMSDEGTHAEMLTLLAAAHEALTRAHRFVHERKPRLDGSGFGYEPVAWRVYKGGGWAFRAHSASDVEALRRFQWQPLYVRDSE